MLTCHAVHKCPIKIVVVVAVAAAAKEDKGGSGEEEERDIDDGDATIVANDDDDGGGDGVNDDDEDEEDGDSYDADDHDHDVHNDHDDYDASFSPSSPFLPVSTRFIVSSIHDQASQISQNARRRLDIPFPISLRSAIAFGIHAHYIPSRSSGRARTPGSSIWSTRCCYLPPGVTHGPFASQHPCMPGHGQAKQSPGLPSIMKQWPRSRRAPPRNTDMQTSAQGRCMVPRDVRQL